LLGKLAGAVGEWCGVMILAVLLVGVVGRVAAWILQNLANICIWFHSLSKHKRTRRRGVL
jgi:hypothetical protein